MFAVRFQSSRSGDERRPPRREEDHGGPAVEVGLEDLPAVDESELEEVVDPHLRGALAREKERLDLTHVGGSRSGAMIVVKEDG
jgi:hypothetical protein